jgi:hypothetical protein
MLEIGKKLGKTLDMLACRHLHSLARVGSFSRRLTIPAGPPDTHRPFGNTPKGQGDSQVRPYRDELSVVSFSVFTNPAWEPN